MISSRLAVGLDKDAVIFLDNGINVCRPLVIEIVGTAGERNTCKECHSPCE
jgi:hypothetical protein